MCIYIYIYINTYICRYQIEIIIRFMFGAPARSIATYRRGTTYVRI